MREVAAALTRKDRRNRRGDLPDLLSPPQQRRKHPLTFGKRDVPELIYPAQTRTAKGDSAKLPLNVAIGLKQLARSSALGRVPSMFDSLGVKVPYPT